MSELQACVSGRRSIRTFTEQPVSAALLSRLVQNAALAPSGSNAQPWEFIVVDAPRLLQAITAFSPGIGQSPPCIIVLCADRIRAFEKGGVLGREQLALMDLSMAAENLLLTAVDCGLGACAVKSFPPELLQRILKLPAHIWPEIMVSVGYPAQAAHMPPKRPLEEIIHYNGWED